MNFSQTNNMRGVYYTGIHKDLTGNDQLRMETSELKHFQNSSKSKLYYVRWSHTRYSVQGKKVEWYSGFFIAPSKKSVKDQIYRKNGMGYASHAFEGYAIQSLTLYSDLSEYDRRSAVGMRFPQYDAVWNNL